MEDTIKLYGLFLENLKSYYEPGFEALGDSEVVKKVNDMMNSLKIDASDDFETSITTNIIAQLPDLANMTREYINELIKSTLSENLSPSDIESTYIRPSFVELGSRYVCQVICLFILYKINEVKSEDTIDTVYEKFHQIVDVDDLCQYFPIFYPAFRHSNDLCYCALSNFLPPSLQDQNLELIIYANNVNDNIKLTNIYPLHLLANESDDIWDACVCSMIYIVCGVKMDMLNKDRQTPIQIAMMKNGALFSVFMNLKIDSKVKQMYSPSASPIPPMQPNQQQQQQGFSFRSQRPSSGIIPRTTSIGSRGGISPRIENDGTPATMYDLELLKKEMKDMQSEFGATLLLFGKITGVYGEAIDMDDTLGSTLKNHESAVSENDSLYANDSDE